MSLRFSVATSAALIGFVALAAPAFALQTIHIPDPNAQAQADGPPDGLFDSSIPDTWQKKTTDSRPSPLSSFHFTMSSSAGANATTATGYGAANQPGSEFYQPLPGYTDPFFAH